ncbi:Hypothetical_protein [Hexamita inflata]|uniref:Hypothetical_protein n=1 Tax=Hexamita inflata TaxID=28002 RepID=A0AA86VGT5_9EUKA|nr:Hypothetical protein HINF_LOCUS53853 [Hexamita inflata]
MSCLCQVVQPNDFRSTTAFVLRLRPGKPVYMGIQEQNIIIFDQYKYILKAIPVQFNLIDLQLPLFLQKAIICDGIIFFYTQKTLFKLQSAKIVKVTDFPLNFPPTFCVLNETLFLNQNGSIYSLNKNQFVFNKKVVPSILLQVNRSCYLFKKLPVQAELHQLISLDELKQVATVKFGPDARIHECVVVGEIIIMQQAEQTINGQKYVGGQTIVHGENVHCVQLNQLHYIGHNLELGQAGVRLNNKLAQKAIGGKIIEEGMETVLFNSQNEIFIRETNFLWFQDISEVICEESEIFARKMNHIRQQMKDNEQNANQMKERIFGQVESTKPKFDKICSMFMQMQHILKQ